MSKKVLKNDEKLGLLIFRLFKDFRTRHDQIMALHRQNGLRAAHSAVIVYLAERPHRLSELASLNGMRPQSMLKLVNELEKLGYVERVPDSRDSRAKLVQFTPEGAQLLATSTAASAEIYKLYADVLETNDMSLKDLLDIMQALLDQIPASVTADTNRLSA